MGLHAMNFKAKYPEKYTTKNKKGTWRLGKINSELSEIIYGISSYTVGKEKSQAKPGLSKTEANDCLLII